MLTVDIEKGKDQSIFHYDFYCKYCKKYFSDNDVKKKRIGTGDIDFTVLKYCPVCNAKDLTSVCLGCNDGLMERPFLPSGGDYDVEGKVEPFCTECGEGYKHVIVGFCQIMKKANLSKRNIRKAIDKVFTHKGLPYNEKNRVESLVFIKLGEMTEEHVVRVVVEECQEDESFIREQLEK